MKEIKSRYQDIDYNMDYYKMEKDMMEINPSYKKYVGADEELSREPKQLLDTYILEISKKFEAVNDFCKIVDRKSKGKITKKSLMMYLKGLDPKLKEVELVSLFKLIDPSKPKDLRYYQMKDGVIRVMYPHIKTWIGEMLNKFDESKKSLGSFLANTKGKIPGKISKDKIREAVVKFKEFSHNQFSFMLDCLEIEEDYNLKVSWRKFRKVFQDLMLRYKLREDRVVKAFFSVKGLQEDKDKKEAIEESQEEHIEMLISIRFKLRMLSKKQASKRFKIVDSNKSKFIALHEFEDFVRDLIPNSDSWTIKKAFEFISGGKKEKISEEKFVDAFINKIELRDREELIYETAKVYKNLYVRINKAMVKNKKTPEEMFDKEKMKIYEIMDKVTTELGIYQTQDLFKSFEVLIFGDESDTIVTKDLLNLLMLNDERHGYKNEYSQDMLEDANELGEELKKRFKRRKFTIHELFQKIDTDGDVSSIDLEEFHRVISFFISGVSKAPTKILFEMIDDDDSMTISIKDFKEYFDIDDIKDFEEQKKEGEKWLKEIMIAIDLLTLQSGVSPQQIFKFTKGRMKRKAFIQILKKIKFDKSRHDKFEKFMKLIRHEKGKEYVDMEKLHYLISTHKNKENFDIFDKSRKLNMPENKTAKEPLDPDVEIFLYSLAEEFQNNTNNIINYFDNDNSGDITKSELVIRAKKLFRTRHTEKYEEVFEKMKKTKDDVVVSNDHFRQMLVKVVNMHAATEAQSTLDESFIIDHAVGGDYTSNTFLMESFIGESAMPNDISHRNVGSKEELDLMIRIRKGLNFEHEKLIKKFDELDTKSKRKVHKSYILKGLKDMGIKDLSKEEEMILLGNITDSKGQVFYLELISKIFPFFNDKSGSVIKDVESFICQIKEELKLRGILSKRLFYEMVHGFSDEKSEMKLSDEDQLTREGFGICVHKKGYGITKRDLNTIFDELDLDRTNSVNYKNFKEVLFRHNQDSDYVLNKINLEIKHKGLEVADIFKIEAKEDDKKKEKKEEKSMDFKGFLESIKKLEVEIDIFDLETLFSIIDKDNSGTLTLEELKAVFKKFDEKKNLNLNTFRKKLFVFLVKSGKTLEQFFDEIDYKGRRKLSLPQFVDILKIVGFDEAEEEDKQHLFELINKKGTYRMTLQELENAYDESNIFTLFPFVKEFKKKLKEILKNQSKTIRIFLRKYDKNGKNHLNKEEFDQMLDDLNIETLKEKADKDFLFNSCNLDNNNSVSEFEIREFLNGGKIVDVVKLIEKMKRILGKRYDLEDLFEQIDKDRSNEIEFQEFEILIVTKCGFKLDFIELDELFRFLDKGESDCISEKDFLDVFSDWKPLIPEKYNKTYFKEISERQRNYYKRVYRLRLTDSAYMRQYSQDDDEFYYDLKQNMNKYERDYHTKMERGEAKAGNRQARKGEAWKKKEKKFDNIDDLKKFADCVDKLLKKYKDFTFEDNMRNFEDSNLRRINFQGFKKLTQFVKFKKPKRTIEDIFEFIDINNKGYIPFVDLQEFLNKYSYVGGDGTLVAEQHLEKIELCIIERLKKMPRNSTLKDYFKIVIKGKSEMKQRQFDDMVYDLGLEGDINELESKKLFEFLDVDKSFSMSYKEFANIFKDKKRLRIDTEERKEQDEVIKSVTKVLRKRMKASAEHPKTLFDKMDSNGSGKISQSEFMNFFSKYDIYKNEEKLEMLYSRCHSKDSENILDFKLFMQIVFYDEDDVGFSIPKVYKEMKHLFLDFERNKRGEIFDLFKEYDTTSSGYWQKQDFYDFLLDHKKQLDVKGMKKSEKLRLFGSLDMDKDDKISQCELFRKIMEKEYHDALVFKYESHAVMIKVITRKLSMKRYDDLFEYFKIYDRMQMGTREFRKKIQSLGIDTSSKEYSRFEKSLKGVDGRGMTVIGLVNDYIRFEMDRELNSDEERDMLKKSMRFDMDKKLRLGKKYDSRASSDSDKGRNRGKKRGKKGRTRKNFDNYREDDIQNKKDRYYKRGRRAEKEYYSSGEDKSTGKLRSGRSKRNNRKKYGGSKYRLSDEENMVESEEIDVDEHIGYKKRNRGKYRRYETDNNLKRKKRSRSKDSRKDARGGRSINRRNTDVPNHSNNWDRSNDEESERSKRRKRGIQKYSKIREEEEEDRSSRDSYGYKKERRLRKGSDSVDSYRGKSKKEGYRNRRKRSYDDESDDRRSNRSKSKGNRLRGFDKKEHERSSSRRYGRKSDDERSNRSRSRNSRLGGYSKKEYDRPSGKKYRRNKPSRLRDKRPRSRSSLEDDEEDRRGHKRTRFAKDRRDRSEERSRDESESSSRNRKRRFRDKKNNYTSLHKGIRRKITEESPEREDDTRPLRNRAIKKRDSDSSFKRRQKEKIKEINTEKDYYGGKKATGPTRQPKTHLNEREKLIVDKVTANVINFMILDNFKFSDLFGRYDYSNNGFISLDDME